MSKSLMINNQAHEPIYEIVFETAFEKLAESACVFCGSACMPDSCRRRLCCGEVE